MVLHVRCLKLASGLGEKVIRFDLEEFLEQINQMQIEDDQAVLGTPREDWFSTHPFSPLRVKALQLFHESSLMKTNGSTHEHLEVGVQRLLSMMEPSYLEARTDTASAMRRLLFVGVIVLANIDHKITDSEIEVFEKYFGKGEFSDELDIDRIIKTLPDRIEIAIQQTTLTQRMQVMRDISLMALVDRNVTKAERSMMGPYRRPARHFQSIYLPDTRPGLRAGLIRSAELVE